MNFRIKWMILHGLASNEKYMVDLVCKRLAILHNTTEDFVWESFYEISIQRSWWTRSLASVINITLTYLTKKLYPDQFDHWWTSYSTQVDRIREAMIAHAMGPFFSDIPYEPIDPTKVN